MRRTRSLIALVAVVLGGLAVAAPASAAPGGGGCQLNGLANLAPPLSSTSGPFAYSFTGDLTTCKSNIAGAPASGTVSAGVKVPETVTLTNTVDGTTTTGTVQYQQPVPQGTGSCGSSSTAGQALASWADGKNTVVDYTTTGALAAVVLQGTVGSSMTLTLDPSSVPAGFSAPSTYTITSDEPVFAIGDGAIAALTFSPATTAQNCATVPVSTANIKGIVGIGTTS